MTSVRVEESLWRRGREVGPLRHRWLLITCVGESRRIKRREPGSPGVLYTHFMTFWLIAYAAAVPIDVTMGSGRVHPAVDGARASK